METVPYTLYEASQARSDRRFRQMWILVIIMLVMLIGTNAGWLVYESQFEDQVITAEQDGNGINIVGGDGVNYGTESDD